MQEGKAVYFSASSEHVDAVLNTPASLYLPTLVVLTVLCWSPISFSDVALSSSLFSLCVCPLPFFVFQGYCCPHLPLSMRGNLSIGSSLRSFSSRTPLLQVLVITNRPPKKDRRKLGKVVGDTGGSGSEGEGAFWGEVTSEKLTYTNSQKLSPAKLNSGHPPRTYTQV